MVSRSRNLEIESRLDFLSNLHLIILKWQNATLDQKKGNTPTQISSRILKPLFCDSFGKLWNLRQRYHNYTPSTWIYAHQDMSNSKNWMVDV